MNNKPSKKLVKEKHLRNKQSINNHRAQCDCEDECKSLTHSRRLCSTNHNAKSMAHLQNTLNHVQSFTKKNKHIKSKDSQGNGSISNRKKSAERTHKRSSHANDSMEQLNHDRPNDTHNKKEQFRRKPSEQHSEHICQCCKENDKEELFLKYKTQVLKTSFLKEEVDKLKIKLAKSKAQNRQLLETEKAIAVPPLAHVKSHKMFYTFPVFRLSNQERNKLIQNEMNRLRGMFEQGSPLDRICYTFNSILSQLKDHITEMDEVELQDGKLRSKVTRELKQYQEVIGKANQEVKELKSKLKKVIRDNVQLSDQVEDQKQELKMLNAMVDNERQHIQGTENHFEKLHRQYTKLMTENDALQAKHNDIKLSNDRLVQLRAQLERQFEKNLQELELANEQINFLKIENEKIKTKKNDYEQSCDRLQLELKELRQKTTLEKQKLTKSKHKLEEQFMSKTQELVEAERLEQKMIGLIRDNDELRKEVQLKELQNNEIIHKLHVQQRQLQAREDEMKRLIRENSLLLADVTNCKKEIEGLNVDISELKRTTENYKNRQLMKSKKNLFEEDYSSRGELRQMHSVDKHGHKQGRLKALADIQSLIKRHRQQLD